MSASFGRTLIALLVLAGASAASAQVWKPRGGPKAAVTTTATATKTKKPTKKSTKKPTRSHAKTARKKPKKTRGHARKRGHHRKSGDDFTYSEEDYPADDR